MSHEGPSNHAESGSASIFAAFGCAVLLVLTIVGVQLGAAMVARHRAESAADLGALAGAAVVLSGASAACAKADLIVRAGGGSVQSCELEGLDVLVVVTVTAGFLGGRASAKARAGPVDSLLSG